MFVAGDRLVFQPREGPTEHSNALGHLRWMVQNVRWGLYHQPTEKTVKKLMANADAVLGNPLVAEVVDRARIEFGRDNLFDFPAKLNTLVHRVASAGDLVFVVRWIFAQMLDKRVKDPFSDRELDGKTGVVAQCHWQRSYVDHLLQEHVAIFAKPESAVSAGADQGSERQNLGAGQELPSGSVGFA